MGYIFPEKKVKKMEEKVLISTEQIEYIKYTVEHLLAEETPGIDVLLHKLTYDLADRTLKPKMDQLAAYLRQHQEIKVVDPLSSLELLLDRSKTLAMIARADLPVPKAIDLESSEDVEIAELLAKGKIRLPVICKPIACSTAISHDLIIISKMEDFQQHLVSDRRYTIQEFINHNGRLLKVYNIGSRIFIMPRPSISNVETKEAAIAFDSQKPFPNLFRGEIAAVTKQEHNAMETIASRLCSVFQISLFGFDVIQDAETCQYFVVDMNYFPSFSSVPHLNEVMASYLIDLWHLRL